MNAPREEDPTFQAIQTHMLDADSEWWPFVFLRPEQHQHFTSLRCALLAVLYGTPLALSAVVIGMLMGDRLETIHLGLFPLSVCGSLFAAFRLGVAPFWNRRAARVRPLYERRAEWRRSLKN